MRPVRRLAPDVEGIMSRAPTHRELEVLRYLAAGNMRIAHTMVPGALHPVLCKGVAVINLRARTVDALLQAGWIMSAMDGYSLTCAGRDVAEVKTFVRAFAEGIGS
jgi:hypothetical protein